MPSDTQDFYWRVTYRDIKTKINVKYGFEYARSLQEYLNIANVVSSAIGGKKGKGKRNKNTEAQPCQYGNLQQAQSALSKILGKK